MTERKRPPKDWEGAVSKIIREAMERGDFENLNGRGRRLDLGDNPFTPPDLRLAYKLLKDGGVSPDWIEEGKEIAASIHELEGLLSKGIKSWRERARGSGTLALDKIITEHQNSIEWRDQFCDQYRKQVRALNKRIDTYNLKVPLSRLQHRRIDAENELQRFLTACNSDV